MPRFITIIILMIFLSACKSEVVGTNGVVYKSALQYNDYIMERQKKIVQGIAAYKNISGLDSSKAIIELDKLVAVIDTGLKEIKGMPAFNGDSAMRNAAAELFTFYHKIFSTDFKEMLEINRKVEQNNYTDEDVTRFRNIQEQLVKTERPLDIKMKEAQGKFADKNQLKLK